MLGLLLGISSRISPSQDREGQGAADVQSEPDLCLCSRDLGSAYKGYAGWVVSTVDPCLAFSMVAKNWLWDKCRYFQCKARLLMLTYRLLLWLLRATGSGGLGFQSPRRKVGLLHSLLPFTSSLFLVIIRSSQQVPHSLSAIHMCFVW